MALEESFFEGEGGSLVGFIRFNIQARGVSLLVKCTLGVRVDLVHVNVGGWLIVADIDVNISLFWVVAVYASNNHGEHVLFFHQLGPFLLDSLCLVLVGVWNAILDPKIDRGQGN